MVVIVFYVCLFHKLFVLTSCPPFFFYWTTLSISNYFFAFSDWYSSKTIKLISICCPGETWICQVKSRCSPYPYLGNPGEVITPLIEQAHSEHWFEIKSKRQQSPPSKWHSGLFVMSLHIPFPIKSGKGQQSPKS